MPSSEACTLPTSRWGTCSMDLSDQPALLLSGEAIKYFLSPCLFMIELVFHIWEICFSMGMPGCQFNANSVTNLEVSSPLFYFFSFLSYTHMNNPS